MAFSDWVKVTYGPDKDPFYYDQPRMFQPQVHWLGDPNAPTAVKQILRFEGLSEEFEIVSQRLRLPPAWSLPRINAAPPVDYRKYYSSETAEIIAHWFKRDISRFQYNFNGENNVKKN